MNDFLDELYAQEEEDELQEQKNEQEKKEQNNGQEEQIQQVVVDSIDEKEADLASAKPKCLHVELYKSVCLDCHHAVSRLGMNHGEDNVQYREYALLGRGQDFLLRQDHADKYIQTYIEKLFSGRQLVLILDLDNTLIHTSDGRLDPKAAEPGCQLIDPLLSIYKIHGLEKGQRHPCRYITKCRPFLAEFLLGVLPFYQVFFYTAGTRSYGEIIMKMVESYIRDHIKDDPGKQAKFQGSIVQTFKSQRLIGRDDNERFQSVEDLQMANQANNVAIGGGDSTLKLKNVFKSLKALAGDNDRIFVIVDDRDDVWVNKSNLEDKDYGRIPDNLLKIQGYFYYDVPAVTDKFTGFEKIYFDISRRNDLDLGLLAHKRFLLHLHSKFFNLYDRKLKTGQNLLKGLDITYFIKRTRQGIFDSDLIINLEYFVQKNPDDPSKDILPSYESNLCLQSGISHVFKYREPVEESSGLEPEADEFTEVAIREGSKQIYLIPDRLSRAELDKLRREKPQAQLVSIFWLYFSVDHMFQLPFEPFSNIVVNEDIDQNKSSTQVQQERTTYLFEDSLRLASFDIQEVDPTKEIEQVQGGQAQVSEVYESYMQRKKKIEERRRQRKAAVEQQKVGEKRKLDVIQEEGGEDVQDSDSSALQQKNDGQLEKEENIENAYLKRQKNSIENE